MDIDNTMDMNIDITVDMYIAIEMEIGCAWHVSNVVFIISGSSFKLPLPICKNLGTQMRTFSLLTK